MNPYERHDWLSRRSESAINAEQPIVDPHHHLWDRTDSRYLAPELHADTTATHNVTHTVFVECSAEYDTSSPAHLAPVGETRFVSREATAMQALGPSSIAAVVGFADLTLGDRLDDILLAHIDAGNGLFRGIRHGANWSAYDDVKNGHHNPPPHLLLDPDYQAGVRRLAAHGLSLDAWQYFDQLDELAVLAHAVPDCSIVVNHLGAPLGIGPHAAARDEMLAVWRAGLAAVAAAPNATLKVGGIGMEHYFGTRWATLDAPPGSEEVAAHWRDMIAFAIDTFGPGRCMFESNYPVDRQTLPYAVLWNAFQILAADYTEGEQADLFAGTARRAYRLPA